MEYIYTPKGGGHAQVYRYVFIIATYEGLQVDWNIITTGALWTRVMKVADNKKVWLTVAQLLTILAPL